MKTVRLVLTLFGLMVIAESAAAQVGPMLTPTPTPSPTPTPTPVYMVLTPPASQVTASTHDGNGPGNVVDNNLGTRWAGSGDGAWLQLDLGGPRLVGYVTVSVYRGNQRRNIFDLQISDDGLTWTSLRTGLASSGTTTQQERYDFEDRVGRYVRYLGHGNFPNGSATRGPWNSVTEVDVYGTDPPIGRPAPPAFIQALPAAGQVTLRWSSTGATSYRIWRRLSQCDTFVLVGASTDGSHEFVDSTVTDRLHYYYAISSVNTAGEGARSEPVAVTPRLQPPPFPTFTGAASTTGITLTWSPAPTATRYVIRRGERKPHCRYFVLDWQTIATVDAPATSYTDTALRPGITYVYGMSAANATGEGPQSPTRDIVSAGVPVPTPVETPCPTPTIAPTPPPPTAPPQPPTITSARGGDQRVRLAWRDNSTFPNVSRSYHIYRGTGPCGPFEQIAWSVPGTTYTATGLTNGVYYYFIVAGVNPRGESLDSTAVSQIAQAVPPEAPPESIGARMVSPTTLAVRLSWSPVWDADHYLVQRSTASGGPYTTIATVPNDPNRFTLQHDDATVSYGTRYYYVLVAVNSAGQSEPSGERAITPATLAPPPTVRARPGYSHIVLSWDPVPGAESYTCRWSSNRGGPYWFQTSPVAGTSVTLTNLTNGTPYYAVCASVNSAGVGFFSEEVSAIPSGTETLVTPPASRVTATHHDGNVPGNVVDDNLGSRWSASGDAWIRLDLGAVYTVGRITVAVYRGDQRRNRFGLEASLDGTTWTTLMNDLETSGTTLAPENFDVPDTPARYVRYVGGGNVANTGDESPWNSVTEIDVYAVQ